MKRFFFLSNQKRDLSHELPLNDRNKEKLGYTQFPNEDGMLCDCDATHNNNNNNNIGVCLFVELFSRRRDEQLDWPNSQLCME